MDRQTVGIGALMVNDVGAMEDIESDVADVFMDEAEIADIYEGVQRT